MKRVLALSVLLLALLVFRNGIVGSVQAQNKCDGFADHGSTHRNAGNGCSYTCNNGSWSGPKSCDGQGNGQFQGAAATNADERRRQQEEAQRRQREAEERVSQQGEAETARIAAGTAQQRSAEAARQQAMVEAQRQAAVARGASTAEAINEARQASAAVAQAAGTNLGSGLVGSNDQRAIAFAQTGVDPGLVSANTFGVGGRGAAIAAEASVNVANIGGSCDPNTGSAGSSSAGGACCRGGVSECGSGSSGHCVSTLDRVGVVGVCGSPGTPDTSGFCGDGFCNGATERASTCAADCRYVPEGRSGAALYQRDGNNCVACQSETGAGCVSYAACLRGESPAPLADVVELSPADEQRLNALNTLTNRCLLDIDPIEGTLDEGCITNYQQIYNAAPPQVRAIVDERRADERVVSQAAFTLGQLEANCSAEAIRLGAVCNQVALRDARQSYNEAVANFARAYPDRAAQVRENSLGYVQGLQDSQAQQRQQAAQVDRRYQDFVANAQIECASANNPTACLNSKINTAVGILAPYSADSAFCSRHPNAPRCSAGNETSAIKVRVQQALSTDALYPLTGRYRSTGTSCIACRENIDDPAICSFATDTACRQSVILTRQNQLEAQRNNYCPDSPGVRHCLCNGVQIGLTDPCPKDQDLLVVRIDEEDTQPGSDEAISLPPVVPTPVTGCSLLQRNQGVCEANLGGRCEFNRNTNCWELSVTPVTAPTLPPDSPVSVATNTYAILEAGGDTFCQRCSAADLQQGGRCYGRTTFSGTPTGSASCNLFRVNQERGISPLYGVCGATDQVLTSGAQSCCEGLQVVDLGQGRRTCRNELAVTPVAEVSEADRTCPERNEAGGQIATCGCGAGNRISIIPGEVCPEGQRAFQSSVVPITQQDRTCPERNSDGRLIQSCGCGAGSGTTIIPVDGLCPPGQRAYQASLVPVSTAVIREGRAVVANTLQQLSSGWQNLAAIVQRSEVVVCPDRADVDHCLCGAGGGARQIQPGSSCISQSGISEVRRPGRYCSESATVDFCLCGADRVNRGGFCPSGNTFVTVNVAGGAVGPIESPPPAVEVESPAQRCPTGGNTSHCTCRNQSAAVRAIEPGGYCTSSEQILVVVQSPDTERINLSGSTFDCPAVASGRSVRECLCLLNSADEIGQTILPGQECFANARRYIYAD